MPTVPVYSEAQVAPSELPSVRQQAPQRLLQMSTIGEQAGQKVASGLQSLGESVNTIITQEQIKQNEAKAKDFDTGLMTGFQAILHGSPDAPLSGYLNQKGQDALGQNFDDVQKRLQKVVDDNTSNLDNPAQQQLVKNLAQSRLATAMTQAGTHMAQQTSVYNTAASITREKVASDGAALSFNGIADKPQLVFNSDDPDTQTPYQKYLQTVVSEAKQRAADAGMAPDVVADAGKTALAQTYISTLSHILDGKKGGAADPGSLAVAKDYFSQIKDTLTADQQDKISKVLGASTLQDNVVTVQRALEAMPGSIEDKHKALGDAFDSKGKVGGVQIDGAIYEHATSAIDRLDRLQQQAQDKATASAVGKAQDFILRNPGVQVTDLPRNLYVALEAKGHLAALDAFANREANKPTDPVVLHNLLAHYGDGSPLDVGKLSETEWMQMKSGMSRKDWLDWDKERTSLLDGEVTPSKDPGNIHVPSFNAALNSGLLSLGINPKPKDESEKERVGNIQDFVKQQVIADQMSAGKRFNQKETQDSVNRLFATNVEFRNTFLGIQTGSGSQRMLSMTPKDLPSGAAEGIKQDLIRGGNKNPTDRDIMLQYWSLHGRH